VIALALLGGILLGALGVWLLYRDRIERAEETSDQALRWLESLETFSWSLCRAPDKPTPGEHDEPRLYVLPGGDARTNSCEAARRAWFDAAHQAREIALRVGDPHQNCMEIVRVLRANVEGRMGDQKAQIT